MNNNTENGLSVRPSDLGWRVISKPNDFDSYAQVANCTKRQLADESFESKFWRLRIFLLYPTNKISWMCPNALKTRCTENIRVSNDPPNILERPTTDSIWDSKSVKMVGTTRRSIPQDFHEIMIESSDTVPRTNDSFGNARNTHEVMSSQVQVYLSREMMTSHNPHVPSITLGSDDEHTNDT